MKNKKNWLEWLVFAASSILLVATLGFLALDAARTGDGAPRLVVATEKARPFKNQWLVAVMVENKGDRAAESVSVEVSADAETSEISFDLIPRGAEREGFAVFSAAPKGSVKARIRGYQTP